MNTITNRYQSLRPTSKDELKAAAKAEEIIRATGWTPEPIYTRVRLVGGTPTVFAFSYESAPGTTGLPAMTVDVEV